jgi:hypothetical protein
MTRVLALVPDLLFGSRVQGDLTAGGHHVELVADERRLRERLGGVDAAPSAAGGPAGAEADGVSPTGAGAAVLVVDLTDDRFDGAAILEGLAADGALTGVRTLAFYSHVDAAVRERAMQAGFDLVVPRSRMAREGAALVTSLAGSG